MSYKRKFLKTMAWHLQYNNSVRLLQSVIGGVGCLSRLSLSRVFFILLLTIALISSGCSGGALGGGGGDDDDDAFEDGPVDIPITIAKATAPIDPSTVEFTESSESLSAPLLIKHQTAAGPGILSGCLYDRTEEKTICAYADGSLLTTVTTSSGCFEFTGVEPPDERTLLVCSDEDGDGTIDTGGPYITVQTSKTGKVTVVNTNLVMTSSSRMVVTTDDDTGYAVTYFCASDADGNPVIASVSPPGAWPEVFASLSTECSNIRIKGINSDNSPVYVDIEGDKVYSCDSVGSCSEVDTSKDDNAYMRYNTSGDFAYSTTADGTDLSVNGTAMNPSAPACGDFEYYVFDWLDTNSLLMGAACSDSSGTEFSSFNVSTSATTSLDIDYLGYMVSVDCDDDENCFGLCDSGYPSLYFNHLCEIGSSNVDTIVADRPINTARTCSGGNPAYDDESGVSLGNEVSFYNSSSAEVVSSGQLGANPQCDPTNTNHTFFFCEEQDTGQVCSFRPDFDNKVAGTADNLGILTSYTENAGACSSTESFLAVADPFGLMTNVNTDFTVNLSTVDGNGSFHSDAACSTSVSSVTISAGSSTSSSFYYKPTTAGTVYMHADDNAGLLTRAVWKMRVD